MFHSQCARMRDSQWGKGEKENSRIRAHWLWNIYINIPKKTTTISQLTARRSRNLYCKSKPLHSLNTCVCNSPSTTPLEIPLPNLHAAELLGPSSQPTPPVCSATLPNPKRPKNLHGPRGEGIDAGVWLFVFP